MKNAETETLGRDYSLLLNLTKFYLEIKCILSVFKHMMCFHVRLTRSRL